MTLFTARTISEASSLLPVNDRPVVIVPVYNSYDDVVRCYEAFFRNTPADVPLLVVDDAGWDRRTIEVLERIFASAAPEHDVIVLKQASNKGFLLTMNDAFAAAGRHDVIILNSDVVVAPEWLERMVEAARSSSTIGTVTTLTNHGTMVSVPFRNTPTDEVPGGLSVDEAARRVAAGSPKLRPRIPTAIGHCAYIKRAVLDVVGPFDPAFSPGYGEEVDFCQRALAAGFEHAVADDVFVFHAGGSSFGRSKEMERRKYQHEQIVQDRYPYYGHWVRRACADDYSPLAASLLAARRSLLGLRIAVDGMVLGPLPAGTQIVVVETAKALARRPEVAKIILYTPSTVHSYVAEAFRGEDKVEITPITSLQAPIEQRADVVYRPYQVRDDEEIDWLRRTAERVVVNQLDFIAYHDAAYQASDFLWHRYRDLAKLAAFTSDGLTYLSQHSRDAAVAEGLLPGGIPHEVVYCGTEHTAVGNVAPMAPAAMHAVSGPYMLCLGVSYHHKNRLFALKTLSALFDDGWRGSLILVGAQPPFGSSVSAEAEFLAMHPHLASHVVTLGMVSEAEKLSLYDGAALVLYPTTSEGFGLIPFEAAHFGVPCLSTRQGSLDEVLPPELVTIDEFDATSAAVKARELMDDADAARHAVNLVSESGKRFTWDESADRVMTVLTAVTGRPANRVAAVTGEVGYATLDGLDSAKSGAVLPVRGIDLAVQFFVDRPDLRTKLVPPGSSRQAYARKSIDRARRYLLNR